MAKTASESGHWYQQDGTPKYEIEMVSKPGEMRGTTLRDARKLNLVPSVTTITKILAAPGLEKWKQDQLLLSALTLAKEEGEILDDFAKRVRVDASEHAKQAAERGTSVHGAIERYLLGKPTGEHKQITDAAMIAINEIQGEAAWSPEKAFAHQLGFGGKVDLHSVHTGIVLDFKTKEFTREDTKSKRWKPYWPEQAMQLAAYRHGLGLPSADCYNVFLSVSEPGTYYIHQWSEEELAVGWQTFYHVLQVWKLQKGFNPAFGESEAA